MRGKSFVPPNTSPRGNKKKKTESQKTKSKWIRGGGEELSLAFPRCQMERAVSIVVWKQEVASVLHNQLEAVDCSVERGDVCCGPSARTGPSHVPAMPYKIICARARVCAGVITTV